MKTNVKDVKIIEDEKVYQLIDDLETYREALGSDEYYVSGWNRVTDSLKKIVGTENIVLPMRYHDTKSVVVLVLDKNDDGVRYSVVDIDTSDIRNMFVEIV